MAKHWQAVKRSKETNKTSGLENNVEPEICVNLEKRELKTRVTRLNHRVRTLSLTSGK